MLLYFQIQIFGYNSQLYANFSDAMFRAQGVVGVAVLLQLGDLSNPELRMLTDQLEKIRFGGDEAPVRRLSVRGLLPDTEHFMTYEGSTTAPACHETVTWMVMNKPIYITKQQVCYLFHLYGQIFNAGLHRTGASVVAVSCPMCVGIAHEWLTRPRTRPQKITVRSLCKSIFSGSINNSD
jgi:hypothetical protein